VTQEIADAFMGDATTDTAGAALLPGSNEHDPGTRTILFTDIVESTMCWQGAAADGYGTPRAQGL
jgi:class 3 adenylate cyclase